MNKSAFFESYRALGFVTDSTPFDLKRLGQESFITVATGKSWQMFNCDRLRLGLISPQREAQITAIASIGELTVTAIGSEVVVWKRTHEAARLRPPQGGAITRMLVIGTTLLTLSTDLHLFVWDFSAFKSLISSHEVSDAVSDAASAVTSSTTSASVTSDAPTLIPGGVLEPIGHIEFPRPIEAPGASVTAFIHPQTYLNKILVGWSTGTLELWNIRTGKMIHRFRSATPEVDAAAAAAAGDSASSFAALQDDYGAERARLQGLGALPASAVTALAKSPAVDVVAVGRASGAVTLLNLRADAVIHSFHQADGPVSALSFRTDGHPFLASTSTNGHITLWDLQARRLHSSLRGAHQAAITSAAFLAQEPVLVTAGADNAVKTWVFDGSDHSGRQLRCRAGHSAPPALIQFYDDKCVLSAGHDRALRMFHLVRDQQAAELSQGSLERQARLQSRSVAELRTTRAVAMASSTVRERDWVNVITAHQDDTAGLTWSTDNKRMGETKLVNANALRVASAAATAVAISACGAFGLVGSADGRVERFNIQSGLFRGRYGKERDAHKGRVEARRAARADAAAAAAAAASTAEARQLQRAQVHAVTGKVASTLFGDVHSDAVTALFTDAINTRVTSASLDGTVRFWDFNTFACLGALGLGSPVAAGAYSADSSLFAAATDDLRLHVVDTEAQRVVRRFRLAARVTALALSPDSRVLVAAQANGECRVFDLSTGRLVDWFVFRRPAVSLTFSPKGDFLATAHTGSLGVFIWVNRSYFSHQFLGLTVPKRPVHMDLAPPAAFSAEDGEQTAVVDAEEAAEEAKKAEIVAAAEAAAKRKAKRAAAGAEKKNKRARMQDSDASSEDEDEDEDEDDSDEDGEHGDDGVFDPVVFAAKNPVDPKQMTSELWGDMLTLSGLPTSKWQQLSMLDKIRQRNKPKAAPKAPVEAPFFLNVVSGDTESKLDVTEFRAKLIAEAAEAEATALGRVLKGHASDDQVLARLCARVPSVARAYKDFARAVKGRLAHEKRMALMAAAEEGKGETEEEEEARIAAEMAEDEDEDDEDEDVSDEPEGGAADMDAIESVTAFLASLSPADIDAEIRTLAFGTGSPEELPRLFAMLRYFRLAIARKRDFEFVQAVAHLFLKIHSEAVMAHEELAEEAAALALVQKRVWRGLEQLFQSSVCMLSHFCNIQQV